MPFPACLLSPGKDGLPLHGRRLLSSPARTKLFIAAAADRASRCCLPGQRRSGQIFARPSRNHGHWIGHMRQAWEGICWVWRNFHLFLCNAHSLFIGSIFGILSSNMNTVSPSFLLSGRQCDYHQDFQIWRMLDGLSTGFSRLIDQG